MTEISIVVPVRNENQCIKPFLDNIEKVLQKIGKPYEIIFALDPSTDGTEKTILNEIERNKNLKLLVFSRQCGQPAATLAGLHHCKGKYCVIIDVDLQDPPEVIEELYNKIITGYEVVYAKRKSRKGETLIKKIVSFLAYYIINKLSEINIPRDTGDFRIVSRKVIDHLKKLNEGHGFLRGMVAFVGFKQAYVEYDRDARFHGKGNYNRFFGSIKIGLSGIIGFSSRPLLIMAILGFFISITSLIFAIIYMMTNEGNLDINFMLIIIFLTVAFFTGIQLFGLGLLGEYVGRIYDEVKKRPTYIVDKKINFND